MYGRLIKKSLMGEIVSKGDWKEISEAFADTAMQAGFLKINDRLYRRRTIDRYGRCNGHEEWQLSPEKLELLS